ncbi:MAG TPA: hypothetical protein VJ747_12745 [Stellaceae bacterium]|nr:hypothetical protein [Stellaceae bacterium]
MTGCTNPRIAAAATGRPAALGETPDLLQAIGIAIILAGVVALSVDRRWLDTSWPLG